MNDKLKNKEFNNPFPFNNIKEQKNIIRAEYMEKRALLPEEIKNEYEQKIANKFLNSISYRHAEIILCYYSINSEISTRYIIDTALADGKKVALPRCNTKNYTMDFHYITSTSQLEKTDANLIEPFADLPIYENGRELAVCIVPAVVFDKAGYRVGYGKGYYDRFLHNFNGSKIGLTYSNFILNKLPRGRYDCAVDVIITERGIQALKI